MTCFCKLDTRARGAISKMQCSHKVDRETYTTATDWWHTSVTLTRLHNSNDDRWYHYKWITRAQSTNKSIGCAGKVNQGSQSLLTVGMHLLCLLRNTVQWYAFCKVEQETHNCQWLIAHVALIRLRNTISDRWCACVGITRAYSTITDGWYASIRLTKAQDHYGELACFYWVNQGTQPLHGVGMLLLG